MEKNTIKISRYLFNHKTIPIVSMLLASWGNGFYAGMGRESPVVFDWLYRALMVWVITWWLLQDDKRFGFRRMPDFGFFVAAFWFALLPYYFIKTRGVTSLGRLILLAFGLGAAVTIGIWMGGGITPYPSNELLSLIGKNICFITRGRRDDAVPCQHPLTIVASAR